jgi:hypothetical protein
MNASQKVIQLLTDIHFPMVFVNASHLSSRSKANRTSQNLSKSMPSPTLQTEQKIKHENTTICIVHSTLRDATTPYMERCV